MTRRRRLLVGSVASLTLLGRQSNAQAPTKPFRIGRLSPLSAEAETYMVAGFRRGLSEAGWVEGRHFQIEFRFADGVLERLPGLAAELVAMNVDVIVTGSNPGAMAALRSTRSIPIVMVTTGDPIAAGIVEGLARPGGNITGVTALGQELAAKRLELLREALPRLKHAAILINPASSYTPSLLRDGEQASRTLGIVVSSVVVDGRRSFDSVFETMAGEQVDAVMVPPDVMFISERSSVIAAATRHRMPTIFAERESVAAGGLMFYGASLPRMYQRAASYVERIAKGARPGDLPIEQPTHFDLVVNLKAAKEIGVEISPAIVERADEVIE